MDRCYIFYVVLLMVLNGCHPQEQQVLNGTSNENDWKIAFINSSLTVSMKTEMKATFRLELQNNSQITYATITFHCSKPQICDCSGEPIQVNDANGYEGEITIRGHLLGKSDLCAELKLANGEIVLPNKCQSVIVLKDFGLADTIFTVSVGIVVTIIFVSFGACLDTDTLKDILLKPIGPSIGFFCQYILMPVISYLLGYVLFQDDINMWLGLFFSGVSPGGGMSNMWTLLLKGNVNLSIVMTTISNLAAFAMMPLWIFTLGRTIFERGNLGVPYERIAMFSVSLIIPLLIGIAIQKLKPNWAKILIKMLKPVSIVFLVYIMIFAIVINFYIFQLFSWKIILGGMGLPWFGYFLSYILAWLLRQNKQDCLTISIEAGLQNTGVAIFLLRFSLDQPEADITSVVPVAVGIMTLVPLLALYLVQRFCLSARKPNKIEDVPPQVNEEERIMPRPAPQNSTTTT